MAVKKASTVLISLPLQKVDELLSSLNKATFPFEVLDPNELGGQWQDVKKLNLPEKSTHNIKLDKLAKIIDIYTPKSRFNFLMDKRVVVKESDFALVEQKVEENYELAEDLLHFRHLVDVHTSLFKMQKDHPQRQIWIGNQASKVAQEFAEEVRKSLLDSSKENPEQLLEFTIPEITLIDYEGMAAIATAPENAKQIQEFLDNAEPDYGWQMSKIDDFVKDMERKTDLLLIKLKKKSINPYKISSQSLKELALTHAILERRDNQKNLQTQFFSVNNNSAAIFSFIAVEDKNLNELKNLIHDKEINLSITQWKSEIVVWNQSSFLQPFKSLVQSLGTIGTKETDPSLAVGIFFVLFFAMALNDALYGLFIALICGYFMVFTNLKNSFRPIISLFFWAGSFSIIVGALTNSWAGNLFAKTPLHDFLTYFQVVNPLDPYANVALNQFLKNNGGLSPIVGLLGFAILVGLLHIFTAYFIKINTSLKKNDLTGAVGEFSWIIFLISIPAYLIGQNETATKSISLIVLGASFLGIYIFNHGHGLMGKITSGTVRMYELVAFFADMLSYTRLVAIGLTSSIIAEVVNLLAFLVYGSMNPVLGFVAAALILIVGHLFNLVVGLFGAYINPLRLHYVEFLPKFFEGKGRSLNPSQAEFSYVNLIVQS